jgi:hypothetical protein
MVGRGGEVREEGGILQSCGYVQFQVYMSAGCPEPVLIRGNADGLLPANACPPEAAEV